MITPQELATLACTGAAVKQNDPTIPLVKRCQELAEGLQGQDYLTMLPYFQCNVIAMSLWLSGFTCAVAMLDMDERLG